MKEFLRLENTKIHNFNSVLTVNDKMDTPISEMGTIMTLPLRLKMKYDATLLRYLHFLV
jgi:hypothetical protein